MAHSDSSGAGLSPRVRGNLDAIIPAIILARSIPACAGEPAEGQPGNGVQRVYPRVCGGTKIRPCRPPPAAGLSPRVRGNLMVAVVISVRSGSIPACAGEPLMAGPNHAPFPVYPRVCGGTDAHIGHLLRKGGLSPRVRGNRISATAGCGWPGSIPACAGEPLRRQ